MGAVLFLIFFWWGGGSGSTRIVITSGQIDSMAAGFTRTWQRPPSEEELKGLVDDYVREEIAAREAMAAGLDRDDTIIRRRLRQKLEFLAEDSIDMVAPTDAELQTWLDTHPESFRREPELAFRQVYVSEDSRGPAAEAEARRILAQLEATGPAATIDAMGDRLMVPQEITRSTRSDVARQFGEEFADALVQLEPGRWHGPIRSGYGLHVVLVRERQDGHTPALAHVRPMVERELLADRRARELRARYERLLDRYRIHIEPRSVQQGAVADDSALGDTQ
jgi:PPIC-type PPIASE domain